MTVLKAHFDGRHVVLDEPTPRGLAPNAPVRVLIEDEGPKPGSLTKIARLAVRGKLPRDFSMQHKHYAKGSPRR
jgi:hypothetical protein